MIKRRNRFKQNQSLEERLAGDSKLAREQAAKLPPGKERDALLARAERNDIAAGISAQLRMPASP